MLFEREVGSNKCKALANRRLEAVILLSCELLNELIREGGKKGRKTESAADADLLISWLQACGLGNYNGNGQAKACALTLRVLIP